MKRKIKEKKEETTTRKKKYLIGHNSK